jgi:broad specificity phosphatase PhoE
MAAVRPKTKSRIRILPVIGYIVVVLGLAWFLEERPTTTIIFVRHAETEAAAGDADPALSARGRQRAEQLADFLANIDVVKSVDAIYATTARRTQETATPLATRLSLRLNIDDPYVVERFIRRIHRDRSGQITLIVTDGDAIAPLIDELHGNGTKRLPKFDAADFDEIYVVSTPYYGKVKTLRLHYGDPASGSSRSEALPSEVPRSETSPSAGAPSNASAPPPAP